MTPAKSCKKGREGKGGEQKMIEKNKENCKPSRLKKKKLCYLRKRNTRYFSPSGQT